MIGPNIQGQVTPSTLSIEEALVDYEDELRPRSEINLASKISCSSESMQWS